MDTANHLERMQYNRLLLPDLKTPQGLHLSHMQNIPFENPDIEIKHAIHKNRDLAVSVFLLT